MSEVSDRAIDFINLQLEKRGLSVNALATLAGETQSTVSRALKGEVAMPFDRLYNLCKAMHIDMRDLITYVETPTKKKKRA
jgi:transcriptional regulator with XRE-family HTH domain